MFRISYWIFPLFAACTWFGTLLAMLIVWLAQGKPHYSNMPLDQHIPYISDIGAHGLKPLFIAGSTVAIVVFDVVFVAERWLRHRGRLAQNTSTRQKWLSACAIFFSFMGAVGLIALTVYDTAEHPDTHYALVCVFIVGYIISAIFICAEYQRLGIYYREHRVLRMSFWIKLFFIIVEIALAIAFVACGETGNNDDAAVIEWVISLLFILYVLSFIIDFLPAIHSKHDRFPKLEMGKRNVNGPSISGGPVFAEVEGNEEEKAARNF